MDSEALPTLQHSNTPLLLFSDYHMHPQGHRVQSYTQELLQPWVDSARRLGLKDIAFTDHDRYYTGIDFDEIDRLRERNPDLGVRAGIELDNDPVHSPAGRKWIGSPWAESWESCAGHGLPGTRPGSSGSRARLLCALSGSDADTVSAFGSLGAFGPPRAVGGRPQMRAVRHLIS